MRELAADYSILALYHTQKEALDVLQSTGALLSNSGDSLEIQAGACDLQKVQYDHFDLKTMSWPLDKLLFIKSGRKYLVFYKFIYLGFVFQIESDSAHLINKQSFDLQSYLLFAKYFDKLAKGDIIWKIIKN